MTFPLITAPEVQKISAIAARLQSDHDGEVLSAARLLTRALDRHGLRIGEIVTRALEPPFPPPPPRKPKRARKAKAKPRRPQWQADAFWALDMPEGFWTPNQQDFLRNMAAMVTPPSGKQHEYLDGLLKRARAGGWQ